MSFDRKCWTLAQAFMADHDLFTITLEQRQAAENELAQEIQDVIESYLEQLEESQ